MGGQASKLKATQLAMGFHTDGSSELSILEKIKELPDADINKPSDCAGCTWAYRDKEAQEKHDSKGARWLYYCRHGGPNGHAVYCLDENDYSNQSRDCPWTLLQYATALGLEESVMALLARGADVGTKDKLGRNALEIAE
jgi:hypothetical protein